MLLLYFRSHSVFNFILALKFTASKSIFYGTVQFEHKLSKIIFLIVVKITPGCVMLPFAVYSYFTYFAIDLGDDAFDLVAPMR